MRSKISGILGIESSTVSHTERLVSALGSFQVILLVFYTGHIFLVPTGTLLIVPSMVASAVLLFAVPHGALSQPWSLLGGHVVSALVGVTCTRLVPEALVAAPLAVGLAVGCMYYLRCIHPPGGATALVAVVGGADVHALGYAFANFECFNLPVFLAQDLHGCSPLFIGHTHFGVCRYQGFPSFKVI